MVNVLERLHEEPPVKLTEAFGTNKSLFYCFCKKRRELSSQTVGRERKEWERSSNMNRRKDCQKNSSFHLLFNVKQL